MADSDKRRLSDEEADFFISSFKNKERRNNPSTATKPLLPKMEERQNKPLEIDDGTESKEKASTGRKKKKSQEGYKELFLQKSDIVARVGKSVNIRAEYHDRILRITQTIGGNSISLSDYMDNVLRVHFEMYKDEIMNLYEAHKDSIF